MRGYYKLRRISFEILDSSLPDNLLYHSIQHTRNALKNCEAYLKHYKVDPYNSKLLRAGVILHDIGFTVSIKNHEEEGSKIASQLMSKCGFNERDIRTVKGLIMATKVPQQPKNLLERIICDVDLDYLGRSDFYSISDLLYRELIANSGYFDRVEWNRMQIAFLDSHSYHTEFAIKKRQKAKEKRIQELKKSIGIRENNDRLI